MKKIGEALSQQSLDVLLDKILEVGYDNLSDRERDMLNNPEKYDDMELEFFNKVVYKEKETKRVKVYDDNEIHISISKFPTEKGDIIFFITLKNLPEGSVFHNFIYKVIIKNTEYDNDEMPLLTIKQCDIYDNIMSEDNEEYINYIKDIEIDNIKDYMKLSQKIYTIVQQTITNIILGQRANIKGKNYPDDQKDNEGYE